MKFLLCVITLDEKNLTDSFSALPERLNNVISSVDGLGIGEVFVVDAKKRDRVLDSIDRAALHFHHYAVDEKKERCTDPECTDHVDDRKVLILHDRFTSGQKPKTNSQPN